jgi:hypothetical protein
MQPVQGELNQKRNCTVRIVKGLATERLSVQALPVKRVEEVMGPQRRQRLQTLLMIMKLLEVGWRLCQTTVKKMVVTS